jgi:hypothetical protein
MVIGLHHITPNPFIMDKRSTLPRRRYLFLEGCCPNLTDRLKSLWNNQGTSCLVKTTTDAKPFIMEVDLLVLIHQTSVYHDDTPSPPASHSCSRARHCLNLGRFTESVSLSARYVSCVPLCPGLIPHNEINTVYVRQAAMNSYCQLARALAIRLEMRLIGVRIILTAVGQTSTPRPGVVTVLVGFTLKDKLSTTQQQLCRSRRIGTYP